MSMHGFGIQPHSISPPKRVRKYFLLVASLFFFVSYFFLHWNEALSDIKDVTFHTVISNQPDEVANYFFVRELVFTHSFGGLEFLNDVGHDQVHPRSMTVIGQRVEPIGFPFFIVFLSAVLILPVTFFGSSFFNIFAISVVPIMAIISTLLFFGIMKRVWNERMALIGSALLYLLPPWWYWASHPFQHTIPFVFFLILAIYSIVRIAQADNTQEKISFLVLHALAMSLALALRPNESVWILFLFGYLAYSIRSAFEKKYFVYWFLISASVAVLFFVVQDAFYGNPFASGYVKPLPTGEAGSALMGGQGIPFVRAFLFPFGVHVISAIKTAYRYFFHLFNPLTMWAFVSFLFIMVRGEKRIRGYAFIWVTISCYLVLSYGSWDFADNLLGVPSIGSSQTRYFMPVYVGMIPLIAYFCDRVFALFVRKKQIIIAVIIGSLFSFSSYSSVYMSQPEGLLNVRNTLLQYREMQEEIYARVPEAGVVVTRYADKYIFPGRKVIIRTPEGVWGNAAQKILSAGFPLYWYDLKLSIEEQQQVDHILGDSGLELGDVVYTIENLQLKEIVLKNESK